MYVSILFIVTSFMGWSLTSWALEAAPKPTPSEIEWKFIMLVSRYLGVYGPLIFEPEKFFPKEKPFSEKDHKSLEKLPEKLCTILKDVYNDYKSPGQSPETMSFGFDILSNFKFSASKQAFEPRKKDPVVKIPKMVEDALLIHTDKISDNDAVLYADQTLLSALSYEYLFQQLETLRKLYYQHFNKNIFSSCNENDHATKSGTEKSSAHANEVPAQPKTPPIPTPTPSTTAPDSAPAVF